MRTLVCLLFNFKLIFVPKSLSLALKIKVERCVGGQKRQLTVRPPFLHSKIDRERDIFQNTGLVGLRLEVALTDCWFDPIKN
ncbi:hypothetical protein VNO77_27962 [Canavalia gladiata]|uniref:Secreted protein n=1 Tax=Canavalia gladiata TaxID=3824 RepID=A0AAN9Q704_CANGL